MARITIFGDSYVKRLATFCNGKLPVSGDVSWVGVGGLRAGSCHQQLANAVLKRPDIVFINIGGNDIGNGSSSAIVRDISTIVDRFRAAGAETVYVSRILGRTRFRNPGMSKADFDAQRKVINKKLHKLYGSDAIEFGALSVRVHYMDDGVHFNDAGMAIYLDRVVTVVSEAASKVSDTRLDADRAGRRLSRLLRHTAISMGIPISSDGFVRLSDLSQGTELHDLTPDLLARIVATDEKGRFQLKFFDGEACVRAVQGHSMQQVSIDMDRVVTPCNMVHGTSLQHWYDISVDGLRPMKRNDIHCASGSDANSGYRPSSQVLVHLDVVKLLHAGCKIYRSANGVLCTTGISGLVCPCFFSYVIDVWGNQLSYHCSHH